MPVSYIYLSILSRRLIEYEIERNKRRENEEGKHCAVLLISFIHSFILKWFCFLILLVCFASWAVHFLIGFHFGPDFFSRGQPQYNRAIQNNKWQKQIKNEMCFHSHSHSFSVYLLESLPRYTWPIVPYVFVMNGEWRVNKFPFPLRIVYLKCESALLKHGYAFRPFLCISLSCSLTPFLAFISIVFVFLFLFGLDFMGSLLVRAHMCKKHSLSLFLVVLLSFWNML